MSRSEPEFLTLDEAFAKQSGARLDDAESKIAFLTLLRARLLAADVTARGVPDGQRDLTPIPSETWRTHVLRFDLGGCAVGEKNAESNVGAAWARRTGSRHVLPFKPDQETPYWLNLLFPRSEIDSKPAALTPETKIKGTGGRPAGQGSTYPADALLLKRMKGLKDADKMLSDTAAAWLVVKDAIGGGTDESKVSRLVKRFKKTYP